MWERKGKIEAIVDAIFVSEQEKKEMKRPACGTWRKKKKRRQRRLL